MNVMIVGRLVNVVTMVGGLVIAVQKLDECPHNKLHTIFQKLNDYTMYFVLLIQDKKQLFLDLGQSCVTRC